MNTREDLVLAKADFHSGERLVQERVGVAERMADVGPRVIREFMPDQHRAFFHQLPYVIVGGLDAAQQPWATILSGPAGFIQSPGETSLHISALPAEQDPLAGAFSVDAPIGLLGLEAHTRRRNRANGRVTGINNFGVHLRVLESFGNCPKYIQAREATPIKAKESEQSALSNQRLDAAARRIVVAADTFFIATAHPDSSAEATTRFGIDVSHRGGKAGFVNIQSGETHDTLLVPDFSGNYFFNTLGNIALNPRVGLLFIDYTSGDLLHVAGTSEIIFNGPLLELYAGAQRLLKITIAEARLRPAALPLRWTEAEVSPSLQATGSW